MTTAFFTRPCMVCSAPMLLRGCDCDPRSLWHDCDAIHHQCQECRHNGYEWLAHALEPSYDPAVWHDWEEVQGILQRLYGRLEVTDHDERKFILEMHRRCAAERSERERRRERNKGKKNKRRRR